MSVVAPGQPQIAPGEGLPMRPGTYWIFRGNVKWAGPDNNVREELLDWKVEVMRSALVGRYEVAVMNGDPGDLIWYETGKQRRDYLIVRDGAKYYRLPLDKRDEAAALFSDVRRLESRLNLYSLFLDLPLREGMCFGREPENKRNDNFFCWAVSRPTAGRINGVKGISSEQQLTTFNLRYYANTDHTIIDFVPGIGITSYVFAHHGTVSEVDVKLVEYHPGL